MNDDKMRQVLDGQWEEGIHFVTLAIFHGSCSYADFLSTNPEARSKKYVDDWLNKQLSSPKYKDKIIPGFND